MVQSPEQTGGGPSDAKSSQRASEIRVLVAEDHRLMRQGLISILTQLCKFDVVGEVGDGLAAVEMVHRLKPDVVLMDVSMPGLTGVEATRRIKAETPETRVVALTIHNSEEMRTAMRSAGASGYLTKSAEASEVCAAIRNAVTEKA